MISRNLLVSVALTLVGLTTVVAAAPPPVAPLPEDAAAPPGYVDDLARFHESETKARSLVKLRDAVAAATPGMALYDATFYDLEMRLEPATQQLTGSADVHAAVVGESLATFDLHLRSNMTVTAVRSAGVPATFSRAGEILTVVLDRTYNAGETVIVGVDYQGDPTSSYFGWDSYGGEPLIWTLSEPYGARYWWPCKDLNTDKPDSVDLYVTVPEDLVVASNGVLVGDTSADGWRTFHWQERYPIAPYLVSLAIHPYAEFSTWYTPQAGGDPMEIRHFVIPSFMGSAQSGYAITDEMIDVFSQAFGEYPFLEEKYGHAHFPWGGAMEHQTCTSISFYAYGEGIISHELAHQWFGDLITCADFHHIWLNEGFATWSEAYWREQNEGFTAYQDEMADAAYWGPGTVYVEDPNDFWEIFDYNLTYKKASWVVHMLRRALGDTDFFAGLALYRQQHGFGSATTAEFQAVMEEVSGRDLEDFFQQWIYREYYPVYRYAYTSEIVGPNERVILRVDQVQTNAQLFDMPLPVRVITFDQVHDFVVENSAATEFYSLEVPGSVLVVAIDPEHAILREVEFAGTVDVPAATPSALRLLPARPNPFNPNTTLRFALPEAGLVLLELYDASGQLVRTLLAEDRPAGQHDVRWDGRDGAGQRLSSGTYFARLRAAGAVETQKLTLVK